MAVTFDEVANNGIINNEVLKWIPRNCKCGAQIKFSDSITQVMCSNKNCYCTLSARIRYLIDALGIPKVNNEELEKFVRDKGLISPYQFMIIGQIEKENTGISNIDDVVESVTSLLNREFTIEHIVTMGNHRYIDKVAFDIFAGYKDFKEAYSDIDKGQLALVADKLGVYSSEATIIPMLIYNELIDKKDELIFAGEIFKIKNEGEPIRIAVVSCVSDYTNKYGLITKLSKDFKKRFVISSIVDDKTNILICEGNTESVKYRNATLINKKYGYDKIQIVGADKIYDAVRKELTRSAKV